MHEQQTHDGQAGFTLIETMIATIVLVFGLIGVVNLFLVASTSNATANQTTAAAALASEQLETLKTVRYLDLVDGGDLGSDMSPAAACPGTAGEFSCLADDPAAGYGQVQLRWTVDELAPGRIGIVVEALPLTFLGAGRARVRLTTIRTCTAAGCPALP